MLMGLGRKGCEGLRWRRCRGLLMGLRRKGRRGLPSGSRRKRCWSPSGGLGRKRCQGPPGGLRHGRHRPRANRRRPGEPVRSGGPGRAGQARNGRPPVRAGAAPWRSQARQWARLGGGVLRHIRGVRRVRSEQRNRLGCCLWRLSPSGREILAAVPRQTSLLDSGAVGQEPPFLRHPTRNLKCRRFRHL